MVKKLSKKDIKPHESLYKKDYKRKEEPVEGKEIVYVAIKQEGFEETRMAGAVNENVLEMFQNRVSEIESLKIIIKTLKSFVKRYKTAIIKLQLVDI